MLEKLNLEKERRRNEVYENIERDIDRAFVWEIYLSEDRMIGIFIGFCERLIQNNKVEYFLF